MFDVIVGIFNGLKKIVGNKADEDNLSVHMVTPDLLLTPSANLVKHFERYNTVFLFHLSTI